MRPHLFLPVFILFYVFVSGVLSAQVWTSVKTVGPFVCWGEFDLAEVERPLAGFTEVHRQMAEKLKLPAVKEQVEVYLFKNDTSLRDFLRKNYPKVPYRRALAMKKKGQRNHLFLCRSEKLAEDIRHEAVHALLDASITGVPEWLHEGLAEYFEVEPEDRLTGAEWFEQTQTNAKLGVSRQLTSLERITSSMSMTKYQR